MYYYTSFNKMSEVHNTQITCEEYDEFMQNYYDNQNVCIIGKYNVNVNVIYDDEISAIKILIEYKIYKNDEDYDEDSGHKYYNAILYRNRSDVEDIYQHVHKFSENEIRSEIENIMLNIVHKFEDFIYYKDL